MLASGPLDALSLVVALLVGLAALGVMARRRSGLDIAVWDDLSLFTAVYWMLLSSAWLPTVAIAALGGVVAALATCDLWSLALVLVAGTTLGWLTTLGYFLTAEAFDTLGRPDTRRDELSDFAAWVVGPVVASIVALVVVLAW